MNSVTHPQVSVLKGDTRQFKEGEQHRNQKGMPTGYVITVIA